MINKPSSCNGCPMQHLGQGFAPLDIRDGQVMMVGEALGEEEASVGKCFVGGAGVWLQNLSKKAGIKWESVTLVNTISCRPPGNIYPTDPKATYISKEDGQRAVAHCAEKHLWPAIKKANKPKLYAIGNHALRALTGKSGINTWRGSLLPLLTGRNGAPCVVPTIHPAALMRSAKLTSVVVRDLRRPFNLPPENYNLFPTLADVERFKSHAFAFDFEWDSQGNITLCGLSDRFYGALVVPFIEPYITELRRIFEEATHLIGHNIVNADLSHIERLGWDISRASIEDTMLKQHLVQPDYPHGLDFVASVFTNKNFWKGKWEDENDEAEEGEAPSQQWRTWDRFDALPKEIGGYGGCLSAKEAFALYNARDTDAEYQINTPLSHMLAKWSLDDLYRHISRPAAYICRWVGDRGLRLDTTRLGDIRQDLDEKIAQLEERLPDGLRPYEETVSCNIPAPAGTWKCKEKFCKGAGKKQSHEPTRIIFEQPEDQSCPTCGRSISPGKMSLAKILKGTKQQRVVPYNSPELVKKYVASLDLKEVLDHKSGRATTGKKARQRWAKDHPEFTLLGALKEKITLRNNFAKTSLVGSAELGLPPQERMFFNLKVHGTGEGRLSSSGRRRGIDLNIQNQPEKFRIIYVPEKEGWGFINLDIVQGENWLTAWIAEDWERWERLQDPKFDEHSDLASAIFNRPIIKGASEEDDALRQIGKKINHGRNYGMGIKKQQEELIAQGYDHYTQADVREFIEIWKKKNARTARWQDETIEIADRQGYLKNAFGRVRWFSSKNAATQALAFLPASTLADMVLRMMICHYPEHFQDSIDWAQLAVYHSILPEWLMSIQVHDSIVLQGPWDQWREQAERSSAIMSQPFPQLNNFHFKVEVKASDKSWGDCKTVKL